ncbi:hypothetical protein [Candidatus Poriferisocius sp.]|uniref:hypothetical protein n=1 Tax=Candidatus Poriferisocius sp. TaxID=3101276 RepID=UPI003B013C83
MAVEFELGDVFEHVGTMVRLGDQAVGQIERELEQRASAGGDEWVRRSLGGLAKEGGSEVSVHLDAYAHLLERRPFSAAIARAQPSLEHARRTNEEVCLYALEQIMVGCRLVCRHPSEPGGTHDVDMFLPGSGASPVRVEFTELTSEMGEQWGKWPRSGRPRAMKEASGQLRYRWHASVNMTDTLFRPEWEALVKDAKERKQRSSEIDGLLLKHLVWAESQMGTFEGAVSLANQRISPHLKPGGRLLVFPSFLAEKPPSGTAGGMTVSYDGYQLDYSIIGSSESAEPINRVIAGKAKKDQAGALAGDKWLVIALDPVYAIGVAHDMEALLKRPKSWLAFESKIERRHFEEVWIVWERRRRREDGDTSDVQVNVVRFTPRDSHFVVCD